VISNVGICVYRQEHGLLKDAVSEVGETSTSEEKKRTTGSHAESGMPSLHTGIPSPVIVSGVL
jgi:hypothetical protein